MTIIEQIGKFCANLEYDFIPEQVLEKAKSALTDTIGVIIAGSDDKVCNALTEIIEDNGGKPLSSILGKDRKVSPKDAALVNGTAAIVHDLDDVHEKAVVHPGSIIIPAALAMAEKQNASGTDLLTAIVVGYEVHSKVAAASKKKCGFSGWYISTICGVFGAAAAAGKILKLNEEEMINALGIASTMAAGNMQSHKEGMNAYYIQPGMSAQNGIMAASLASKGIEGPKNALEGQKSGFYDLYFQEYDASDVLSTLGTSFSIMDVSVKPYASNRCTHSSISAVQGILENNNINTSNIEKVTIKLTTASCNRVGHKKLEEANEFKNKLCAPYAVAVMLSGINITPNAYSNKFMSDPDILSLMEKIEVVGDPDMDQKYGKSTICPAEVEILTKDGGIIRGNAIPKGSPAASLSRNEIEDKFKYYAGSVLKIDICEKTIHNLNNIQEIKNINDITINLCKSK